MSGNVFDHLRDTYFQECAELLDTFYGHLATLEDGSADGETVHALFRAIHSIKGGGGAFGFSRLVAFAHAFESLLDLLRDGKLVADAEVVSLLLRATDMLSDLIGAERSGIALAADRETAALLTLERVASMAAPDAAGASCTAPPSPSERRYRIAIQPHPALFRNATEPLLLIRELQRLGDAEVTADLASLPQLDVMDPEAAYIGWMIVLRTAAPLQRIEEVFEFTTDQCDVSIVAEQVHDACVIRPQEAVEIAAEPVSAARSAGNTPRTEAAHDPAMQAPQTVRVDVEKVDRLVNLVGELVINQAMLIQLAGALPPEICPGLINGLDTLSQHLRELQEGVMAIRTQPVKSVFSRMPRLVRELSAKLGKEARLHITGEGTEIDKTVIEQLADPLTHLLRNAIDHGIEPPAERVAQGKPEHGSIHLAAEHRGGRIMIEVSDDGRGIDRTRVLERARARGLVAADARLSDEEIDNLIFLPGFSTVDTVSSISGRGVGMDVVRRNIHALGGRIILQSRRRAGSRFVMSLPLTLAILDGMIVAVGAESYIIPLMNITESLRPRPQDIHSVAGCCDVVAVRGHYIPLLHLASRFRVPDAKDDPARGIVVVVESEGDGQIGIVVDELVGQQQVVVKSLETNYGAVEGIGGATILGNGRVALILDIAGLRGHSSPARGKPQAGAACAAMN